MTEKIPQQLKENPNLLTDLNNEAHEIRSMLKKHEKLIKYANISLEQSNIFEKLTAIEEQSNQCGIDADMTLILKKIQKVEGKYKGINGADKIIAELYLDFSKVQQNRGLKRIDMGMALDNTMLTAQAYNNKWGLTKAYLNGVAKGTVGVLSLLVHPSTYVALVSGVGMALNAAAQLIEGEKTPAEMKAQIETWALKINKKIIEKMKTAKPEEMASIVGIAVGQVLAVDIGIAGVQKVAKVGKEFHIPELMALGLETAGVTAKIDRGIQLVGAFSGKTLELVSNLKALESFLNEIKTIKEALKISKIPTTGASIQKLIELQAKVKQLYSELIAMMNSQRMIKSVFVATQSLTKVMAGFLDDIALAVMRGQAAKQ
ncbi:MAG: hypothetical protein WC269_03955 [Candidatus Gracilibacteria bacterium]|jgi:hypothetical protein